MPLAKIEEAVAAIGRGEIVVVVDDEDRENEGDLIMAAEFATPESIAFFLRHTSGVICATVTTERARELDLDPMVQQNTESQRTAFLVTVDYRHGTTTGISAADRAATIQAARRPDDHGPATCSGPGHIFPLEAREGGVLKRAGHTEAAIDLARLAGCYPAGVLCEIVTEKKDEMARLPDLERFAEEHGLLLISIADLIRYRRKTEKLVRRLGEAAHPDAVGRLRLRRLRVGARRRAARRLRAGRRRRAPTTCSSGCTASASPATCSARCAATAARSSTPPCSRSPRRAPASSSTCAATRAAASASATRSRRTRCRTTGVDTVDANLQLGLPADSREYGVGAQILVDLGVTTMRLMTNNTAKYGGLEGFGLEIVDRVPLVIAPNPDNERYLATKRERMGHLFEYDEPRRGPGGLMAK